MAPRNGPGDVRDPGALVPRHHGDPPPPAAVRNPQTDFAPLSVEHDVPRQLRNRRGDQGGLRGRASELNRQRASALAGGDDVAVRRDRHRDLLIRKQERPLRHICTAGRDHARRPWFGPAPRKAGCLAWRSRWASPPSRSSAAVTPSRRTPSWVIAKPTSGWMPTITVSAPR